jgi:hypothetical protein
MMSIAVQTTGSSSSSNNNLKRRSEATSGVGGYLKKSFHDQQHSKSHSEILLLRRDESRHSLAQPQTPNPAEGKLPKGGSGTFFKKLFQR